MGFQDTLVSSFSDSDINMPLSLPLLKLGYNLLKNSSLLSKNITKFFAFMSSNKNSTLDMIGSEFFAIIIIIIKKILKIFNEKFIG